ncbi:MAG: TetR/AcrR family transcriptional regulator [Proteobacteria bacterium]|nr:TetR/AcrR family transcriptional regulator [Pseudomonadota bacterium]
MVQNSPPRRSRGRPRKFDPADALKAASERFRTHGYAATSLDDLVEATGLARPSLYAAFGDKRALYLAALDRTIDRVGKSFDTLIASGLPLAESLAAMFRFVIDGYLTGEAGPSGCIMISTSAASAVDDPAVRERLAAFLAIEDQRIEELLAARGDAQAHAHARLVTAVIHSLSVRARAGASRDELDAIAAACITLIV